MQVTLTGNCLLYKARWNCQVLGLIWVIRQKYFGTWNSILLVVSERINPSNDWNIKFTSVDLTVLCKINCVNQLF